MLHSCSSTGRQIIHVFIIKHLERVRIALAEGEHLFSVLLHVLIIFRLLLQALDLCNLFLANVYSQQVQYTLMHSYCKNHKSVFGGSDWGPQGLGNLDDTWEVSTRLCQDLDLRSPNMTLCF